MSTAAADLGSFAPRINEWQQLLAASRSGDTLWQTFGEAAHDIAKLVPQGLERSAAVDVLNDMASAHGLEDIDTVQQILADAFRGVQDADHVPDLEIEQPRQQPAKTNGHGKPALPPILSKALFAGGLMPLDYLIHGMLQRRFIYALTGQTGHAKTAIALLIAQLVASSDRNACLGRHRVKKGRVIYFVGENPDDVRLRVIASDAMRTDEPDEDNMWFVPGRFFIGDMLEVLKADMAKNGTASLIIVDTSAAYFVGQDENANPQMAAHAAMLRKLTELPGGPCVLVLCHPIKHAVEASQLLPRGGGAFLAEMDGNLTAFKRDDGLIELNYTKMRGPGFEPMTLRLESISTDKLTDTDGNRISTVRAVAVSQSDEDQAQTKTRADEDAVLIARLAVPDEQQLSIAAIALACGWTFGDGTPARSRAQKTIDRLLHAKLLRNERGQYLLTDKGKDAARKAGLRLAAKKARDDQISMPLP